MESRLSDSVFKTAPQRVATTLMKLAGPRTMGLAVRPQVSLTHEQISALAGTSRETATKVLGDLADRGLIRLGGGPITLLDAEGIADEGG
ncbi:MAG: Crp/Fnr family transcriptional regulator [Actinobacteria bacterium]|nr:Crp/Fnr family transcriptional regulator [Actinomycetota bacterium]